MEKEKVNKKGSSGKTKKFLVITLWTILSAVVFCSIIFAVYSIYYSDKILPNVIAGDVKLGGKTSEEAHDLLSQKIGELNQNSIRLSYSDKSWTKNLDELNIEYNLDSLEKEAMLVGHHPNFLQTLKDQIRCLFWPYNLIADQKSSSEDLRNFIAKIASEIDQPEKDAKLSYSDNKVQIISGQSGKRLDQNKLFEQIKFSLNKLEKVNLTLNLEIKEPNIAPGDLNDLKSLVENYLAQDFKFSYEKRNFTAVQETLWSWFNFTPSGNKLEFSFDQDKMKEWITEKIAKKIDSPAKDPRLKMENGQVKIFQEAKDGLVVDQDKLVNDIISALREGKHQTTITTKESKAQEIDLSKLSNAEVKDLIGTATTNFVNSPNNRVTNIRVGASMFNGVLVRPGEEISVVDILGQVDASTGYLPELVIKEDGTKPEYGGGLCQVSTTFFRAAMNAGLTITERTNHRYRVSYYEPPVGMDATIYLPAPDLKIKNTYNGYLLIQAKVEDYKITFNIYGKPDGRKVKITDPAVYDVTSPPDPQYVETDTMCKGEMKKIESSHDGAKARFEYYVYDAQGKETNKQVFNSTYVPWQAKYLVGTKEGPDCTPPEG